MYHSTLEDVEGRNFKVIDVVFTFQYTLEIEELLADLNKQAESLGANGIIDITYSGTPTWNKTIDSIYPLVYNEFGVEGDNYVRVAGLMAYGTAIKFED